MPEKNIDNYLNKFIEKRIADQSLRVLRLSDSKIDFCSNDYLGFARSEQLERLIQEKLSTHPEYLVGSTGSRLITGHSALYEYLESAIAKFHHAESGLIFNSGYDANLGVFSSIPHREDTILYDQLVHASIRDGIRLSSAKAFSFLHNDLNNLEEKFKLARGQIFVAVESIYSMDGDAAPLNELVDLCERYNAHLIVDEAHATGIFGPRGEGRVVSLGLENRVFVRIHTFGKALGCHGAIVLGSQTLKTFLINFARSFIYTTALPPHSLIAIQCAYELLQKSPRLLKQLRQHIDVFKSNISGSLQKYFINSDSAIQSCVVTGNQQVKQLAVYLQDHGFDIRPIMYPTVPRGKERIRICLHTFNKLSEILRLLQLLELYFVH